MGFNLQTGYSLPGADKPLTHARILHAGNRFPIKSVTASAEASATFPALAVDNALTAERWKPFANLLADEANFAGSVWTATNVTVGADGQTITETAVSGAHGLEQSVTWNSAGGDAVFAVDIDRQSLPEIQLLAFDGTNTRTCWFDLRDLTVGSVFNATGQIIALGGDSYRLKMYFTANSAAGRVEIQFGNGSEATSYGGSVDNTVRITRAIATAGEATLRLDTFAGQIGTMFAIAGHNLGTGGARITFQHDSNADGTFTDIEAVTPTDDSPIMFLFGAITSSRWQIKIDRGALPEVAVVRVGAPLQMERAIHQGQQPLKNNRQTAVRGNLSEAGQWIGRSTIRTALQGQFEWKHLTPAFIAANIDGRDGIIQAMEREPAFIAWRPETYDEVNYIWTTGPLSGPVFNQSPNLSSFSLPVQALGFE